MKCIVISLPGSTRRRDSVRTQFADAECEFQFFDAIDGAKAPHHIHHYDDAEFVRNCGRSATANEIGCYASHLALWRQCAQGDEALVILEDDSQLNRCFIDGIRIVEQRISRWGFIRIAGPAIRRSSSVEIVGAFDIRRCQQVPLLALGYAISPRAAARLARIGAVVQEPVDKFMQRFWLHKQPIQALRPYIVTAAPVSEDSEIGNRTRPGYGFYRWSQRLLRKTENSIRRELFNATYFRRRPRLPPDQSPDRGSVALFFRGRQLPARSDYPKL